MREAWARFRRRLAAWISPPPPPSPPCPSPEELEICGSIISVMRSPFRRQVLQAISKVEADPQLVRAPDHVKLLEAVEWIDHYCVEDGMTREAAHGRHWEKHLLLQILLGERRGKLR